MSGILSYCFRDREGRIVHSSNEDIALLPASNMKVVSGYTAYRKLGNDFEFKTRITLEHGILTVWGDPSPLLTEKELQEVFQRGGINGVNVAEVKFASNVFDNRVFADGWGVEDKGFCYQTKVVPYSISEGCFSSHKEGNDGKALHDFAFSCVDDQYDNFVKTISRVLGRVEGLSYSMTDTIPEKTTVVHTETLSDILDHIETYSCNFSIEVLAKYLSHKISGVKGNWEDASRIITGFMSEIGLNTDEIKITDASGLSRLNLLTTSFLSSLIEKIVRSKHSEFIHFLPSPGKGTLRNRLAIIEHMGLYAKTGSINHCSSLTGYIEKAGVSFSVIVNNSLESEENMRSKIDDTILSFLKNYGLLK